jgi:hypothetical protein
MPLLQIEGDPQAVAAAQVSPPPPPAAPHTPPEAPEQTTATMSDETASELLEFLGQPSSTLPPIHTHVPRAPLASHSPCFCPACAAAVPRTKYAHQRILR